MAVSSATQRTPIAAAATLQPGGATLTGNGNTIDLSGAARALVHRAAAASGAAGVFTFEHSFDGGQEWATCDEVVDVASADGTTAVTETTAGDLTSGLWKVDPHNGPCLFRARISTDWTTNCPVLTALRVG